MKKNELSKLITGVLHGIGLFSSDARELLMGTCAQESALGKYRRQIGGGPALGIFQMEPATFHDIVKNYLNHKPELKAKVLEVSGLKELDDPEELVFNDRLAVCMARVHYLRVSEKIPSDLNGWAEYYKKYYNTYKGRATTLEFKMNYKKYCI